MYNLKNYECQAKFKDLTSKSTSLTSAISSNDDLNTSTKTFLKTLNQSIHRCFKKVRIVDKPDKEIEKLFEMRRILKNLHDEKSKDDLAKVEKELAEKCAESNYKKIREEIDNIKTDEGGFNSGHLWKLKKKLSPKCRDPPTAMVDREGNLVTSNEAIEAIAIETYKKRLENRAMKDELKQLQNDKENVCKLRLKLSSKRKTPDWTMDQLNTVLKNLKKNKSRDPLGYANELFQEGAAGDDLKQATLVLVNRIKNEQIYPEALEVYDISSIYKNKGKRNSFENYRGIFRVPIFRSILDRLIYNDEYQKVDDNLSDCNVGARKNRNIRDNIFVLNAITNSVVNGKEESVDVQLFDVDKCFDSLWVEECINDIHEAGLDNDKLALLYLENQNANIAIKTPTGKSKRFNITNIIMQGTVWGSLLCTASMDKLAQLAYKNEELLYKYKGVVDIPTLGMVDDLLSIQKCSTDTLRVSAVINSFIESKKLKLSESKCHKIHIKNKKDKNTQCSDLKVHESEMKDSNQEKYLGDLINSTGTIRSTVEQRKSKGFGIVNEIIAILDEIPLGRYRLEIGLRLRQAMLVNGMLYNSEAWHSVSESEIKMLETVDEHLLRSLVKGQAKTPLEFLYLEAGATPIRFIISSRRLVYHQCILKREETEVTKRVYNEQKCSPTKGDFVELLKQDFKTINVEQNDSDIIAASTMEYKKIIKSNIKSAAFKYLRKLQESHSKIKEIKYENLETQPYMVSPLFSNEEVNMLHALRSRSTDCKANFNQKYIQSNLLCPLCKTETEDQQHLMKCSVLMSNFKSHEMVDGTAEYEDI